MYFYYNNDYILTNGDEMENINKQEHIDETLIKDVVMMAGRILLESGAEGTRRRYNDPYCSKTRIS